MAQKGLPMFNGVNIKSLTTTEKYYLISAATFTIPSDHPP